MARNNLIEINLICCISSLKPIVFGKKIKNKINMFSVSFSTAEMIGFLKYTFYLVGKINKFSKIIIFGDSVESCVPLKLSTDI